MGKWRERQKDPAYQFLVAKEELKLMYEERDSLRAELETLKADPRLSIPLDGPGSHRADLAELRALRAENTRLRAKVEECQGLLRGLEHDDDCPAYMLSGDRCTCYMVHVVAALAPEPAARPMTADEAKSYAAVRRAHFGEKLEPAAPPWDCGQCGAKGVVGDCVCENPEPAAPGTKREKRDRIWREWGGDEPMTTRCAHDYDERACAECAEPAAPKHARTCVYFGLPDYNDKPCTCGAESTKGET